MLVDGNAELLTGNETKAIEKGAVIHSTSGGAFTVHNPGEATTKLLVLSGTAPGETAGADRPPGLVAVTPVECFSLYDVTDEVLHRPEAGFLHMGTRMLLNAARGGYRSFIFGQSSFAPDTGVHELHRHPGADEMFFVWDGEGAHMDSDGTEHPMNPGDAVFVPRNEWHGFRNIGKRPVRAFFGLIGTGVMQQAGNEVLENGAPVNAFVVPTDQQSGPTWMTRAQTDER